MKNSKFKIEMANNKVKNTSDSSNVKKEKCGEILITIHGIFEINCLLCYNSFKNIRNYAKHILRSHFQCEVNSTIEYLVEIENIIDLDQNIKSENQQTPESENIIKNENDSNEYDIFVNNQELIEEVQHINVESMDNVMNEMEMNYSLFDNNTENKVDSELDIDDDVPLSDLKKLQNSPKNIKNDDTEDDSICSKNFQPENVEFISHSIEIEDENKNIVKDIDNKNDKLENISENFVNKTNCKNCGKEISKNKLRSHLCANDGSRCMQRHMIKLKKVKKKKIYIASKTKCNTCGKEISTDNMRKHIKIHDNFRKTFKCDICKKVLLSEKNLDYHVKSVHTNDKPFECTIEHCGKKFVDENSLKAHITRHTRPQCNVYNKSHQCNHCFKLFASNKSLNFHIKNLHTGEKPFICEIDKCGKRFIHQSRLDIHVKQHNHKIGNEIDLEPHPNSITISETLSNSNKEKIVKQPQLIKLKEKTKISVGKIICDVCGKEFSKVHIKKHLETHNPEKNFKCDMCTKLFKSEENLNYHIRNFHINDKPFACTIEQCEKRFVNKSALKWHIIRHTSRGKHKCEMCDKTFIHRSRLKEHIKNHHVNGRIFGCDTCGKQYFDQSTLDRHQVVHSGEKPFECDECPAKFSRQHTLAWHKKSHSDVKDFTCKICGKQYALYNGIYSHMKGHGIKYSLAYEKGLTDGKSD